MLGRLIGQGWLKTKVIPISYWADKMAVDLIRQPIQEFEHTYITSDPEKYYECKFYSYLARKWNVDEFDNKYEEQTYKQALQRFHKFDEVLELMTTLHEFDNDIRTLYYGFQRMITNNNFLSRKTQTNDVIHQDMRDIVVGYRQLIRNLAEYPEWQKKVKEEVGHYAHLLYMNIEAHERDAIFEGFNKQDFFA